MLLKAEKIKKEFKRVTILFVINIFHATCNVKQKGLIYILNWTPTNAEPFNFLPKGQKAFQSRKCNYQNCFITSNHSYFSNVLDYDVVVFNAVHMNTGVNLTVLPKKRSHTQKYILVALEPAGYYPLRKLYNEFFNFTWTYKLDSDVPFPYIIVRNHLGEVIGPKMEMHWMNIEDMNDASDYVKRQLQNKYIAAAWFVSNCKSYQRRHYVKALNRELAYYGQRVDTFGQCGEYKCPLKTMKNECFEMITNDYYFYLAFENSFGADYVSEKLMNALGNYAVPVVLGGANYTRFMPDGIYLDALKLGPADLAKRMSEIINDTKKYQDFFRWHNHYKYNLTSDDSYQREVCGLCELLNNDVLMRKKTIVHNITQWWNEESPVLNNSNAGYNMDESVDYMNLVIEDEDGRETGGNEIVSKLYNLVFGQ